MDPEYKKNIDAMARLISRLTHDYNNKLAIIVGYTDLLKSTPAYNDVQKFIDPIADASEKAIEISEQMLEFSRLNFKQATIVDVKELVETMAQSLKELFSEKIGLTINIDSTVDNIKVDAEDFKLAIMNLAENARQAMRGEGSCVIKISNACVDAELAKQLDLETGGYLLLEIFDTGQGMSEDVKSNMYSPMFTTKGNNSGMGLSQVYGFVRRSKGAIDCISEPDKGCRFTLYLPAASA